MKIRWQAKQRRRATRGFSLLELLVVLAISAMLMLLASCSEEPLPGQQLRSHECLQNITLDKLPEHISHCDAVVAAFPANPSPLNDRYLLHSLAGNEAAACADIAKASSLARQIPANSLDPQLRNDLKLRQELCRRGKS